MQEPVALCFSGSRHSRAPEPPAPPRYRRRACQQKQKVFHKSRARRCAHFAPVLKVASEKWRHPPNLSLRAERWYRGCIPRGMARTSVSLLSCVCFARTRRTGSLEKAAQRELARIIFAPAGNAASETLVNF